jgi:phosphomannomutase
MAGLVVPRLFERLPATLVPLYMDLDGTFPNHPADPIQPENQRDLRAAVVEHHADLGLAFDGDADRVFLVDEHAGDVSGSLVTALVATGMLQRFPGSKVVHNLITSWAVPEVIRENGGVPVRTRVGHSFIKQVMAETGAVFGGEHSGHYYFRDHYRADSGLVASMVVMDQLSKAGVPLSELLAPFDRYRSSGEINSEVTDQAGRIEEIAAAFRDGRQDRLDGLTVEFDDWWFNVRPSNTEPLLRLNVEARTSELLEEKTAEVQAIIRGGGG